MNVLYRTNPTGMYVGWPELDQKHEALMRMLPIPVVHGMTLGELARMINGEVWLAGGVKCALTVICSDNYTHQTVYDLPVAPSPNLPNMRSVYLYSSLCFFEGTPVSIGRGTDMPFQVYGHPQMSGRSFSFTPASTAGAKNPPQKDKLCHGVDMRTPPSESTIIARGVDLSYVIEAYNDLEMGDKFFTRMFGLLTGVDYVRTMIIEGRSAEEIRAVWQPDVEDFKIKRKDYLLYEE